MNCKLQLQIAELYGMVWRSKVENEVGTLYGVL